MAQLWKSGAGASRHDYIFETLKVGRKLRMQHVQSQLDELRATTR